VEARSFAPRPPTPTAGPHPARRRRAKPLEIHVLRFIAGRLANGAAESSTIPVQF
jgi:hypothetical protein